MSRLQSESYAGSVRAPAGEWEERYPPPRRAEPRHSALPGLLLGGLALAGLGALAWYYIGPDLRRYLKIKSM
jgi:hypothetical protein